MKELGRLQSAFADAVLGGDDREFVRQLAGDAGMGQRRLAVYRRAILANRTGALRAAFPVVARLVGDAFFDEAALRHAEASPPECADLNRYGASFPAFIAGYRHAAAMSWLSDVARLEWAWQESLLAADAPGLDFAALARVPERGHAGMRFSLHPCVRLVRSAWPVLAIWEANQPDRDGTPSREEGADDVLVWREDQRVRLALLTLPEFAFVEGLARGLTLEAAAGLDDGWDFGPMLQRLAEHGMLCGFST
ncbi:MAG TPA: DNA-binding domain-containing protein [Usitatibacteraceae bacterium]|nr:DNA-binding domain-containing protein [Usitatibacteraceae bacterium]